MEIAADPLVMKEHRGAEIFLGSFNCFESQIDKSGSQGQPPQNYPSP